MYSTPTRFILPAMNPDGYVYSFSDVSPLSIHTRFIHFVIFKFFLDTFINRIVYGVKTAIL